MRENLRRARAKVAEGEEHLRQQHALVSRLEAHGRYETIAHELLRGMKEIQMRRIELERLRRELQTCH